MICQWKDLLSILPPRWRGEVDRVGCELAQNLRFHLGVPPEICCGNESRWLTGEVSRDDLNFIVNTASRYSPWAATTIAKGYLTAKGGHRIGICGDAVMKDGNIQGLREISFLCIRVARDLPGISRNLCEIQGSTLILGSPGRGKTTLLRDLIRCLDDSGHHISVLDEREELFPAGMNPGKRTSVLRGCPKGQGIDLLLRTMGPEIIALDEITAAQDCLSLEQAAWCGVRLLATAHASSLHDFLNREVYKPLVQQNLFDNIVILHADKSWHLERSRGWITNGSARY